MVYWTSEDLMKILNRRMPNAGILPGLHQCVGMSGSVNGMKKLVWHDGKGEIWKRESMMKQ